MVSLVCSGGDCADPPYLVVLVVKALPVAGWPAGSLEGLACEYDY